MVEEVHVNWEGLAGLILLCFEDGYACQMPNEASVLREADWLGRQHPPETDTGRVEEPVRP